MEIRQVSVGPWSGLDLGGLVWVRAERSLSQAPNHHPPASLPLPLPLMFPGEGRVSGKDWGQVFRNIPGSSSSQAVILSPCLFMNLTLGSALPMALLSQGPRCGM